MDQLFTRQFWHDQWAVVASAPWVIVPLLLIAGLVGWKAKGIIDDGQIRGLRAQLDVADQRLRLATERYEAVVQRENELKHKVAQQDRVIARTAPTSTVPVNELQTGNTEIRNALTNLSTSTAALGDALIVVGPVK